MLKQLLGIALIAVIGAAQDESRQIWDGYFAKSREQATAKETSSPAPPRPQYKVVAPSQAPKPKSAAPKKWSVTRPSPGSALGITIWKMEVPTTHDEARLLVQEGPANPPTEYTPHRVEAGEALREGDRVRLAVETPTSGYLYVVDQEIYSDGSFGPPYLIFPVTQARGGDNRVDPGRLVEIPAREDKLNVFTIRATKPDERGERLTILLTPQPISGLNLTPRAQPLPMSIFGSWIAQFQSNADHFELIGGRGQSWSKSEEQAGGGGGHVLTVRDPAPQTIFVFREKVGKPLLTQVFLRIAM
jgi:hypothetical protein